MRVIRHLRASQSVGIFTHSNALMVGRVISEEEAMSEGNAQCSICMDEVKDNGTGVAAGNSVHL